MTIHNDTSIHYILFYHKDYVFVLKQERNSKVLYDEDQEKATNCLSKHSIIIAGAGCGKTTTLIKKIKRIINSGVNENEILVISFTNETVNNFIKKCPYRINVNTFHKEALKYIQNNYDIADEYMIENVIKIFLENIPDKLKKKIYHNFQGRFKFYNKLNYKLLISSDSSMCPVKMIKNICRIIKTNNISIEKLSAKNFNSKEKILIYCSSKIIKLYNKELEDNKLIDFDDIIIKATDYINKHNVHIKYKYILVDEYQDISIIRENFLKALVDKSKSILTVVGDDWQSIYRFSGSNISLFLNFEKRYKETQKFLIRNTYRCPQKIINISTKFILKNKIQIKKEIISTNKNKGNFKKIYTSNEPKTLYKIISKITDDKSVLIISRNNYDIYKYTSKELEYKNNSFIINGKKKNNIRFMTIHKSKGLEADIVIIINLKSGKNGFPSSKYIGLEEKLINCKEPIKHAEERRLFYVAITRTKSDLYMIINKKNSSIFANET